MTDQPQPNFMSLLSHYYPTMCNTYKATLRSECNQPNLIVSITV